jgi:energy-converting hydrogenase Eha subunit C
MSPHLPIREFARANRVIALALVWSGVVACVVAACTVDFGRWLHAW